MDDVFGLLAFVSLIAAQFLAVVVAYSERFESDLRGGQQRATGTKSWNDTPQTLAPFIRYLFCGR